MNFMSAPRQFHAQGRGKNPAAADRRVAGDADF
jgi:hypothetical protein